jgi:proteasome lid subunit RPN8/RPN11
MTFSMRAVIRACVAPDHQLSCSARLWRAGLQELAQRGEGKRESGAFLLGERWRSRRRIRRFVCYDDLDPCCLETGIVVFDGAGYGPLWQLCRETGLDVVADVHTHPGLAQQSDADRRHPMVATAGHIAIIVPWFAERVVTPADLGVYEYRGQHSWTDHSGQDARRFFYIGIWG